MSEGLEEGEKAPVTIEAAVKEFKAWLQEHDGISFRDYGSSDLRDLAANPNYYWDRGEAASKHTTTHRTETDGKLNGVEFQELRSSDREATEELSEELLKVNGMDRKERYETVSGKSLSGSDKKPDVDSVSIDRLVADFRVNLQEISSSHKPQALTQADVDAAKADTFKDFGR